MDLKTIEKLIKMVNESNLKELEIESGDLKVRLKNRGSDASNVSFSLPEIVNETKEAQDDGVYITSPLVGVFRSLEASKKTAVKVGDKIEKGQSVCIIEAMKLMNEIESDFTGEIIEVLVNDGDTVEFEQKLFKVKVN